MRIRISNTAMCGMRRVYLLTFSGCVENMNLEPLNWRFFPSPNFQLYVPTLCQPLPPHASLLLSNHML